MSLLKNPLASDDRKQHTLEIATPVSAPFAVSIPNHFDMYCNMDRPMLPSANLAKEMLSNDLYRIQPKDVFGKHEYTLK